MTFAIPRGRSSLAARVTAMASDIHSHWQTARAERRNRLRIARELATSSDRELAELGFSRADLRAIACGSYQR